METPAARARIKGTVSAPVVAPEASKEIARNSGENMEITRMIPYMTASMRCSGMLYTILARPRRSHDRDPHRNDHHDAQFCDLAGGDGVDLARYVEIGFGRSIKNPSNNPTATTIQILFDFAMDPPIMLPIRVMPISTPLKKDRQPQNDQDRADQESEQHVRLDEVSVKFSATTSSVISRTA